MVHLLNNMSDREKNIIREQHLSAIKTPNHNFSKLLNSKLGNVKPLVNEEIEEGFFDSVFGKPSVKDAAKTQLKGLGYSYTGKDDEKRDGEDYVMFNGEKFFPENIEYADYQDLGNLPRVDDGKLIIANPVWSM